MSKDARYRLYCICPQDFLAMLKWERRDAVALPKLNLPDASELEAVNYDPSRDVFLLRVYHHSFKPVPNGEHIPKVEGWLGREWVLLRKQPDCYKVGDVVYNLPPTYPRREAPSYWHQRCLEAESKLAESDYVVSCEWRDKCKAAEKERDAHKARWEATKCQLDVLRGTGVEELRSRLKDAEIRATNADRQCDEWKAKADNQSKKADEYWNGCRIVNERIEEARKEASELRSRLLEAEKRATEAKAERDVWKVKAASLSEQAEAYWKSSISNENRADQYKAKLKEIERTLNQ